MSKFPNQQCAVNDSNSSSCHACESALYEGCKLKDKVRGQTGRGDRRWGAGGRGEWADLLHRGGVLLGLSEVGRLHAEALGVTRGVHSLEP